MSILKENVLTEKKAKKAKYDKAYNQRQHVKERRNNSINSLFGEFIICQF